MDTDKDDMVQQLIGLTDVLAKEINKKENKNIQEKYTRDLRITFSRIIYHLKKLEIQNSITDEYVDEIMDDVFEFFNEEEFSDFGKR